MKILVCFFSIVWILPAGILAGVGKIPIFEPTLILSSGHYQVTRDFSVSGANGIVIHADNVSIDLGGHTITMLTPESGILINHFSNDVVVRNGTIVGAARGIFYSSSGGSTIRLVIEDVNILNPTGFGIDIDGAEFVDIRGCRIQSTSSMNYSGILVDALPNTSFRGSICDNVVVGADNYGIRLRGLTNGRVMGNQVSRFSQVDTGSAGVFVGVPYGDDPVRSVVIQGNTLDGAGLAVGVSGIHVLYVEACLIKENTVSHVGGHGLLMIGSPGTMIDNNAFQGCAADGINVNGQSITLRGNTSRSNTGNGICVNSTYSILVDGNDCTNNTEWGLNVNNGTGITPYRNNLLTGNTLGAVTGGWDEGGNIL